MKSTMNYQNNTLSDREINENHTEMDKGTDISSSGLMEKLYTSTACFGMIGMNYKFHIARLD